MKQLFSGFHLGVSYLTKGVWLSDSQEIQL